MQIERIREIYLKHSLKYWIETFNAKQIQVLRFIRIRCAISVYDSMIK